jgi:hypothetical protein
MAQITNVEVSDNGDGTANVQLGMFGFTVDQSALFSSPGDHQIVLANVGTFLREAGFSSLTAEAVAAVRNHTFRI